MFISIVPQAHCRIIERFGKPVRIQNSGLVFRIPILEQVKNVSSKWGHYANDNGVFIQLTEQILDTQPRECITRDNAKVSVNCIIRWRIVDPIKAVYDVEDLLSSLINAVLNTLRAEIGSMDLDAVLSARLALTEKIISALSATSNRWGISVVSLEIQELTTDKDTSDAMLQQMEASRKSRAIVSEAEGTATAIIKKAEAEKNAAILKAQGLKEALSVISEAEKHYLESLTDVVGAESAAKLLLTAKVVEGYNVISSNPASKVFVPSNINGIINYDK